MTDKIRVVLVDDHDVVRQGFKYFIDAIEELELVGEASNGQEAIKVVHDLKPDIVLMDMMMPKMNGIEATKAILDYTSDTKIIALTSFVDDETLVKQALEAGASGYFFKNVSVDELANAVRKIHNGEMALASDATRLLVKANAAPQEPEVSFTEREQDVIKLMVDGLNNREIGEQLFISRATVKFHISSVLSKLGVTSRVEATAIIIKHKLV
ncbi:MAG: response regulator transcription factor [Phototrophicaceae bacterium]